MQGYDISFLVTNIHCEEMYKHKIVDFVVDFMEVRYRRLQALERQGNTDLL